MSAEASTGKGLQRRRASTYVLRALTVAALLYPLFQDKRLWIATAAVVCYFAAAAMTYALVIGYARTFFFAPNAVVGLGAYTYGVLTVRESWPVLPAALAATVVTGLICTSVGLPSLRLRGFALGILTIEAGGIFFAALDHWTDLSGGFAGLPRIPHFMSFADTPSKKLIEALVILALMMLLMLFLTNGNLGRLMIAVGDDENAAASFGIRAGPVRLFAIALSTALGGLVGAAFAQYAAAVTPGHFSFTMLIDLAFIVFLGGMRSMWGIVTAAILVKGVPVVLDVPSRWLTIATNAAFLALLLFRPQGLFGEGVSQMRSGLAWRRNARVRGPLVSGADADLLEVANLSKHYEGVRAVDDISLTVRSGEILALIGPNGSGKTTLLNCLSGFTAANGGSITLRTDDGDVDLIGQSVAQRARRGIGRSFQVPRVIPGLSVRDNVRVALEGSSGWYDGRDGEVDTAIETWQLGRWLSVAPDHLTHSARRWVELARLDVMNPPILLLDEPAAGVSDEEKVFLEERIAAWRAEGRAVVLVEHDMEMVGRLSDRVIVLVSGHAVYSGPASGISGDPDTYEIVLDRLGPSAVAALCGETAPRSDGHNGDGDAIDPELAANDHA